MTAPRSPRSAWLLVGFDAVGVCECPKPGPAFEEVAGELAVVVRPWALAGGVVELGVELGLQWRDPGLEPGSVAVLLELLPGFEEVVGDGEAGGSEVVLFALSFAVGGEVAEEVRPAELTSVGVEVVVSAPAV